MKRLVIGILAHVDAGKTTLCEAMLYHSGAIRNLGRVDHGDAFLDTQHLERERGITIFSKQAMFAYDDFEVTLLDTPGHVDFSAEMERTLQVLDYAIVLISGTSGVQGHTHTLWELLRRYQIPTFVFVNKMDVDGTDRIAILEQLQTLMGENCVDFSAPPEVRDEQLAVLDDALTEQFLQTGSLSDAQIAQLIANRQAYPCYFGSALKMQGIEEFLSGLRRFTLEPRYGQNFGARVFKIFRDAQGARLTFLKVTGGTLRVKALLKGAGWEEKADQLRLYSGEKYTLAQTVPAGAICAVTGLSRTLPGDGLGFEREGTAPVLAPVLEYRINLPETENVAQAYAKLRELAEEDPQLQLIWDEHTREIRVGLMGEIQMQILKDLIEERFSLQVEFDEGSIVYRETIEQAVEGVGHYEPLRHYAEVHLLLEPAEAGSGLRFDTMCGEDALARNWQRLILTHLSEKTHKGVLTGAPITDMRITLLCGRAHLKHTEGGDFRQATYRAVRQGLRKAKSVLLEPWYRFRLQIPSECAGRAMTDLDRMGAQFDPPEQQADFCILRGLAPVSAMRGYHAEVASYSRGRGKLHCTPDCYRPCKDQEKLVQMSGYDAERDLENPCGSVFCDHGAGFEVKWDEVEKYCHLPMMRLAGQAHKPQSVVRAVASGGAPELEKELLGIFERTYGAIRRRDFLPTAQLRADDKEKLIASLEPAQEYVLVDGYNVIFSWDELREIARDNIDASRHILMNLLCNYQGYRGCALILVFDAYRVPQGLGSVEKYHNIHIVYTKEAETADQYIERVTFSLAKRRKVRVVSSDSMEQLIILGHGAERVSTEHFHEEVMGVDKEISRILRENNAN